MAFSTEEQKRHGLPGDSVREDTIGAYSLSEPQAGF